MNWVDSHGVNATSLKVNTWVKLMLVSFVISVIVQQDLFLARINQPAGKVAVAIQSTRTQLSDKQFYFLNAITFFPSSLELLKTWSLDALDETPGCTASYISSIFISGMVTWLARALIADGRDALLISVFTQTFLFVLALVAALFFGLSIALLKPISFFPLLGVGLGTVACIDVFSRYFVYAGFSGVWNIVPEIASANPDILRSVNPQMSWALVFLFILFLQLLTIKPQSKGRRIGLIVASVFVGLSGLALSSLVAAGLGLYGLRVIWLFKKSKVERSYFFTFLSAGLIVFFGFLLSYLLNAIHLKTEIGQYFQLGTQLEGFHISWPFLLFLPLIPIVLYFEKSELKYFYCGIILVEVLLSVLVAPNLKEGNRLWLRSGSVLIWFFTVIYSLRALVYLWDRLLGDQLPSKILVLMKKIRLGALVFLLLTVYLAGFHYYKHRAMAGTWHGYISTKKWEALDWLNRNSPRGDVVLSSNLEDSYLVPILTRSKTLVRLLGNSNDVYDQIFEKYIFTLKKFGVENVFFEEISTYSKATFIENYIYVSGCFRHIHRNARGCEVKGKLQPYWQYQVGEFLNGIVYYSYSSKYGKVFGDTVDSKFIQYLERFKETSGSRNFEYQWVLLNKKVDKSSSFSSLPLVFENEEYRIYKN